MAQVRAKWHFDGFTKIYLRLANWQLNAESTAVKQEENILNEPVAMSWFNVIVILSDIGDLKWSFFEIRHPKKNNY